MGRILGGRRAIVVLSAVGILTLAACTATATSSPPSSSAVPPSPEPAVALPADCPAVVAAPRDDAFDVALHDELIAMFERDQAGRLGTGPDDEGDAARTQRLREILAEHGWPSFDLVGEDGEDAAWTIAQHSDLDPQFQRCALAHLDAAVAAGQGSPGNLAYLHDRVAVAAGERQRYGTQVQCAAEGPQPATPLEDAAGIDALRAAADLPPWEDYLAEMTEICAAP